MNTKTLLITAAFLMMTSTSVAKPQTMRLDYYHTGNATHEGFSVDRVVVEPHPWPGDPGKHIDNSNLGKYLFEVRDQETKQLVYSRGFASIYGEWETTDEAKTETRTFHESLRFPAPTSPVEITLKKRDAKNAFKEIWRTVVDPESMFVDRSKSAAPGPLIAIQKMGEPETKVDFLIIGDGYTQQEIKKFEADARRMTEALFATSPFKERTSTFGHSARPPSKAGSHDPPQAFTGTRQWAQPSTLLVPRGMCSHLTTKRCARWRLLLPTNS
jgi:hypothetical protein